MVRISVDHPHAADHITRPNLRQVKTLHVIQHSMAFDMPPGAFSADLNTDLSHEPDVLILGEMNAFRSEINAAAQAHGYQVAMSPGPAEAFLIKGNGQVTMKGYNTIKVLNQFGRTLTPPWYSARYISWVRCTFYDQVLFLHTQHWIAHIDDYPQFLPAHVKQTKAMGQAMRDHGEGAPVSFMFGDLNWDISYTNRFTETTRPDKIFATYGCRDIYTELNVGRPSTFHDGRTLDYAVRYLRDTNVSANRFKLWPGGNSDHRAISFWYDIDLSVVQPPSVGGSPGDTTVPGTDSGVVDPDFYVTGGNVDYSDLMDDTQYAIERITEDSDYLRS